MRVRVFYKESWGPWGPRPPIFWQVVPRPGGQLARFLAQVLCLYTATFNFEVWARLWKMERFPTTVSTILSHTDQQPRNLFCFQARSMALYGPGDL